MMVISPYEAQELLPEIKKSKIVALHLYSPRPNLSFRALDDLDLYTIPAQANRRVIPRVLVVLLNLFAGQLYLGSYKEYVEVCQLLGLAWRQPRRAVSLLLMGSLCREVTDRQGRRLRTALSSS
jgi:hypothetical protein